MGGGKKEQNPYRGKLQQLVLTVSNYFFQICCDYRISLGGRGECRKKYSDCFTLLLSIIPNFSEFLEK